MKYITRQNKEIDRNNKTKKKKQRKIIKTKKMKRYEENRGKSRKRM